MNEKEKSANRLKDESSPYLLQHAYNPVDWYPWSEEAFERARNNDKPIFLSIGYSTCHWCHVMERESFSDPDIARVLNQHYICIKVDREERPDIDQVYMTAAQMLSGTGGWPLSIFMTPEKKPFFATTYIPKESIYGRTGLMDLLPRIASLWRAQRENLLSAADEVANLIGTPSELRNRKKPGRDIPVRGYEEILLQFDRVWGGFGGAPKFPMHSHSMFLHRYWKWSGSEKALEMVQKTLEMMARGGIYDHLGFGFHRYSTDRRWMVPHFEKMLYDQAMAVLAYTESFQITGNTRFREVVEDCLSFVARELTSAEGGFFSARDADSEGEEGKYYLWTRQEIRDILTKEEDRVLSLVSHITTQGNFLDPAIGDRTGKNIIHLAIAPGEASKALGMQGDEVFMYFDSARRKLLAARQERPAPSIDDKILTDWNGLMIAAFSSAFKAFQKPEYLETAENAATFIIAHMKDQTGALFHRYRGEKAGIPGMAGDYAYLIWGLIELYSASFRLKYLSYALELENYFSTGFWDEKSGGYYTVSHTAGDLIARQKELYDGALPSPNSVAYSNLIRLFMLTGDVTYRNRAVRLAKLYTISLLKSPASYTFFTGGLMQELGPASQVVIIGEDGAPDTETMIRPLQKAFLPFTTVLLRKPGKNQAMDRVAAFTSAYTMHEEKATAYVCSRHTCKSPTTDADQMKILLGIED